MTPVLPTRVRAFGPPRRPPSPGRGPGPAGPWPGPGRAPAEPGDRRPQRPGSSPGQPRRGDGRPRRDGGPDGPGGPPYGSGGGGGGGRAGRGPGRGGGFDGRGPGGPGPGGPGGSGRRGDGHGKKRSLIWRVRRPLFLIGLAMLAAVTAVGVTFANTELPEVEALTQSTYICAADVEAGDPRGLPEHDLLRPWRLRRGGRQPGLLRRRRA